jgi:hypothetical protein
MRSVADGHGAGHPVMVPKKWADEIGLTDIRVRPSRPSRTEAHTTKWMAADQKKSIVVN